MGGMTLISSRPVTGSASILSPEHRWVTIAAIALVTLGAYENRAITTILPVIADDLDGLRWFGLASAIPAATYLVATTVAGTWTDHRGPRRPLLFSLVLFALAQIASGLAPSMEVLLTARALSGIAEGGLDIALVVLVSDQMPEALRAKVFAAFATAWIVPSLVGPAVAGGIAQWLGWRAAFLLPLIMLIAVVPALLPALRRATARGAREFRPARFGASAVLRPWSCPPSSSAWPSPPSAPIFRSCSRPSAVRARPSPASR